MFRLRQLTGGWSLVGLLCLVGPGLWVPATAVLAEESPAKLVYVVREGDKVFASNVLFSRSDELELTARETIFQQAEDNAIVALMTNQRLIAYSVYTAAWVTLSLQAGETVERLEAEDYSAFALTNRRILNFNGRTGNWSQTRR
jgi:hypothetical protein